MINRSASEPDVVWVTELWMSQEALDGSVEQLSTDEGKARIAEIIALLADPPELTEIVPQHFGLRRLSQPRTRSGIGRQMA